jgi:hypothetical protein
MKMTVLLVYNPEGELDRRLNTQHTEETEHLTVPKGPSGVHTVVSQGGTHVTCIVTTIKTLNIVSTLHSVFRVRVRARHRVSA